MKVEQLKTYAKLGRIRVHKKTLQLVSVLSPEHAESENMPYVDWVWACRERNQEHQNEVYAQRRKGRDWARVA